MVKTYFSWHPCWQAFIWEYEGLLQINQHSVHLNHNQSKDPVKIQNTELEISCEFHKTMENIFSNYVVSECPLYLSEQFAVQ